MQKTKRYGEVPSDGHYEVIPWSTQAIEALEAARSWMAHNAPGDEWSNRVRTKLNRALARAGAPLPDHVSDQS